MNVVRAVQLYVEKALKTVDGMKVLLLDADTTGMVSVCFSQSQILQKEVYLFEKISQQGRQLLGHLKAVCLLRPTPENLDMLIQGTGKRSPPPTATPTPRFLCCATLICCLVQSCFTFPPPRFLDLTSAVPGFRRAEGPQVRRVPHVLHQHGRSKPSGSARLRGRTRGHPAGPGVLRRLLLHQHGPVHAQCEKRLVGAFRFPPKHHLLRFVWCPSAFPC
jgi:Sec1 family